MRLYGLMYRLEADQDIEWGSFPVSEADIMLINHHLSEADGDDAMDILKQTRAALYELVSGDDSLYLAPSSEMEELFDVEVRKNPEDNEKVV